jgi:uncharacterized integral membrane protein
MDIRARAARKPSGVRLLLSEAQVFGVANVRYVRIAIAILLLLAIIIFAAQNLQSVKVSFLKWSVNAPQVFVILGTYILGMITGWGLVELLKRSFRDRK